MTRSLAPLLIALVGCRPRSGPGLRRPRRAFVAQLIMSTGFIGPLMVLAGAAALFLVMRRWLELRRAPRAGSARALARGQSARRSARGRARPRRQEPYVPRRARRRRPLPAPRRIGRDARQRRARTATESLRLGNRVANLARLGGVALLVGVFGTTAGLMSMLRVIETSRSPSPATVTAASANRWRRARPVGGPVLLRGVLLVDSRLTQRILAVCASPRRWCGAARRPARGSRRRGRPTSSAPPRARRVLRRRLQRLLRRPERNPRGRSGSGPHRPGRRRRWHRSRRKGCGCPSQGGAEYSSAAGSWTPRAAKRPRPPTPGPCNPLVVLDPALDEVRRVELPAP